MGCYYHASPDDRYAAVVCADNSIKILDLVANDIRKNIVGLQLPWQDGAARSGQVCIARDPRTNGLAFAGHPTVVEIYDPQHQKFFLPFCSCCVSVFS